MRTWTKIILPNVANDSSKLGLKLERSEIVNALHELIADGLAKAYRLSGTEPFSSELPGMPPLDFVEENFETYLYITKKGMDLQLSDDPRWPFDNDGEPRPNWRLDERLTSG